MSKPDEAAAGEVDRRALAEQTLTAAIWKAVQRELAERRVYLDAAKDLGEFTIRVKLHAGTTTIRAVECSDERVNRRMRHYDIQPARS